MGFAQNLRQYRLDMGMKQKELAKKAGIHQSTVSYYERGLKVVDLKGLDRIANALNCTPSELIGDDSDDRTIDKASDFTGLSLDSCRKLHEMREKDRKFIDQVIMAYKVG